MGIRLGRSPSAPGPGSRLPRLGQGGAESGQCRPEGKPSFFSKIFAENTELSSLGQDNHLLLAILFWETGLCAFNDTRLPQERCVLINFFFLIQMETAEHDSGFWPKASIQNAEIISKKPWPAAAPALIAVADAAWPRQGSPGGRDGWYPHGHPLRSILLPARAWGCLLAPGSIPGETPSATYGRSFSTALLQQLEPLRRRRCIYPDSIPPCSSVSHSWY